MHGHMYIYKFKEMCMSVCMWEKGEWERGEEGGELEGGMCVDVDDRDGGVVNWVHLAVSSLY